MKESVIVTPGVGKEIVLSPSVISVTRGLIQSCYFFLGCFFFFFFWLAGWLAGMKPDRLPYCEETHTNLRDSPQMSKQKRDRCLFSQSF